VSDAPRLVIVGGSDAGISAGLRAREIDPRVRPTIVVADAFPNFSICGIPYWISGEVNERANLAHRTREDLEQAGLELRLDAVAERIDVDRRELMVRTPEGHTEAVGYDRLIIGTGALPARPPIPGIDLRGVHLLHSMGDATAVHEALEAGARSAVIVGAGYIGVEMADALTRRGLDVTLLEQASAALTTVDPELGALVVEEMTRHGVRCEIGVRVTGIEPAGERLAVTADGGVRAEGEIVLVLAGVTPDTRLARDAGARLGVRGAIVVDREMRTGLPGIWSAGDCVVTHQQLLDAPAYMPLGSTAHKQGRVAGENAVGGHAEFAGSLGTQAVKVFDLVIAGTGLRETIARANGFDPITVQTIADDHKAYYPGAHPLHLRIVGDREDGMLLGAQILGHVTGQVSKRIDTVATAIYHRMTVTEVSDLDLSYTPPLSSPWDPVQIACQAWERARSCRNAPRRQPTINTTKELA
jgi:NADPH-dependent 2,4-dienoyl-CoA reductase/sulfur reductase-like enzyme